MISDVTYQTVKTEFREADTLQRVVANLIARSPAGVNLLLIGGFRYRLLDNSQRFSVDIDYHWGGDLEAKQQELLSLCRRVILGQVRRELRYDGSASTRMGPDADSPNAKFIDLRFWRGDMHVEIPVELTQIVCLDPPTIRTAGGTVHATPSDTDLIESKIIAVLNRLFLQHRDLVDVFLYGDKLQPDSSARLDEKLLKMQLLPEIVARRLKDLRENRDYHGTAIQRVIDEQMETSVAQQINAGGGGRTVLDSALSVLMRVCAP
ncbi:MAG TPA: nucleotidyl transferase AbiEii/AbiGii toxin family protein [Verrucomicrobiae bacterium]